MVIALIFLLSIISAILYRMGGSEHYNTKARDVGCSAVTTFAIYLLHPTFPWFVFLIHFGALWGFLTTYWDFLNKDREVFWTWLITGFFYGLAAFSFLGLVSWWVLLLRAVILSLSTTAWRMMIHPQIFRDDIWDETGVGFLLTITTLIL